MGLAAALVQSPGLSLPQVFQQWGDLKAAYRFLSNPRVMPDDIQASQRQAVLRRCADAPLVLCVQDSTDFSFTRRKNMRGLGIIGDGDARGFDMHSALAVTPDGDLLGVLDQRFIAREFLNASLERRSDRLARWRESMLWHEVLGRIGAFPPSCRIVVVADRGGDDFTTLRRCAESGHGFVIRARHDRAVLASPDTLWGWASTLEVAGRRTIRIGRNPERSSKYVRVARAAEVSVRFGVVDLKVPYRSAGPVLRVGVVYVHEDHPPEGEGIEPVDWLLLCSDEVSTLAQAEERVSWYSKRWVIEEWHRALKEGCRLESFQLDQAQDVQRLAVILGPVAAWLLQTRDLVHDSLGPGDAVAAQPDHAALTKLVSSTWIKVVATSSGHDPATITPRMFWLAIARRGGYIGRNRDGPPGWKTIWRGWHEFRQIVDYLDGTSERPRCG